MAVLLSVSDRARVQSTSDAGARIKGAQTVQDAIAIATSKVRNLKVVSVEDVIARKGVVDVVLVGGANANILRGKSDMGKPHVSLRTQYAVMSPEEGVAFIRSLATMTSVEEVQDAWYKFQDEHVLSAVVWEGEACWGDYADLRARFRGELRADAVTGNVSIANLVRTDTPPKAAVVHKASELLDSLLGSSEPVPAPVAGTKPKFGAKPAVLKTFTDDGGEVFVGTAQQFIDAGMSATDVAALADAPAGSAPIGF